MMEAVEPATAYEELEPAIELHGISKSFRLYHDVNYTLKERIINWRKRGYDLFWALRDIDLVVPKGRTLSIIGPNGSGKSTLLRLMTRIMSPNTGTITTHGSIAALLELGAGFHPDLTGRENIYLNGSVLGFRRRDLEVLLPEIVEFSELGPFIDNQVKNYSSGMYVRLGFSIAINLNPDILLIDEVLAVGDEAFQTKCLNRLSKMQQEGKTIVLVTHNTDIAAAFSNRMLWLEKGRMKMLGDPKEVADAYRVAMRVSPVGSEFGTREASITSLDIIDGEGKPSMEFRTGDAMTLRVGYEAKRRIEDPVFGFGIYNQMGLMVYGTNTRLRGINIPFIEGKGRVDFHTPALPMLDGRYHVSAAIHTRDEMTNYHWMDKMYYFDVTSPGEDAGFLIMDCRIDIIDQ